LDKRRLGQEKAWEPSAREHAGGLCLTSFTKPTVFCEISFKPRVGKYGLGVHDLKYTRAR
jgi:hypothetical protein